MGMKAGRCALSAAVALAILAGSAGAVDMIVLSDFEDLHGWKNLEQTTDTVKAGESAGVWKQMDKRTAVTTTAILHDWSDFNAIEFWAHMEKPSDAAVQLVMKSEDEATEGMDYYTTAIRLNWQGWKRLRFPFHELGVSRKPIGWHKIDMIQISASGWGHTPDPEAVLTLDDMRLVRLTITDMFKNTSFEDDADGDGIPDGWAVQPKDMDDAKIEISTDAHTGEKAIRVYDQNKKMGVGASQYIQAETGKTYRFSCWKKGGSVAMYFKWYDGQGKFMPKEKVKVVTNRDPEAYEHFEFVQTAPEGTAKLLLWIYSFSTHVTDCVVDDLKIEEVQRQQ